MPSKGMKLHNYSQSHKNHATYHPHTQQEKSVLFPIYKFIQLCTYRSQGSQIIIKAKLISCRLSIKNLRRNTSVHSELVQEKGTCPKLDVRNSYYW